MAGREVLVPCPHCRSVLRYRIAATGELLCANCLLCGHPFPAHLLEAVGSFVAETSAVQVFEEDDSRRLGFADTLVEQWTG